MARRPIRFTRVLIGGETDPGGIEYLPGVVTDADADEVRHTAEFQRVAVEHPKLDELTVPVEEPCQQSEPEPEGFTFQTM